MISLTVNGEPRRFEAPLTAAQLIASLQRSAGSAALEHNGQIVPRGQLDQQQLADGDCVEIVVAVGGG
jgi:sulfur carrier protein